MKKSTANAIRLADAIVAELIFFTNKHPKRGDIWLAQVQCMGAERMLNFLGEWEAHRLLSKVGNHLADLAQTDGADYMDALMKIREALKIRAATAKSKNK